MYSIRSIARAAIAGRRQGDDVGQTTVRTAERRDTRQSHPRDRFDEVPRSGRVGAHRFTARPRYVWQYVVAALLGFALLTTIGILTVHSVGAAGRLPTSSPSEGAATSDAPQPELNPDATVAVLNGTPTPNLATAVDQLITSEEWGQIRFSGSAAESDVAISAVFYSDEADAAAAAGLAAKLGGISTYITEDYAAYEVQLVVLIGADYQGPGLEEAQAITDAAAEVPSTDGADAAAPAIDPATGYEIDPATGWPVDPASGWPIDPATGAPVDPATLPAS